MKNLLRILSLAGIFALAACEEQGPMEQAGEAIDDTAEEVRERAEGGGDDIEEAAGEVGDEIDDATDGA